MYYLYWIHLDNHTDPFSEGYVGMSKNPKQRLNTHTTYGAAFSKGVRAAIADLGIDAIKHTLLSEHASKDAARDAERHLRPYKCIGWNVKTGGGITPDCSGRTHTESSKAQISVSNKVTKAARGYIPSPFKGLNTRHSADTKALIGSYHKGKTISEAHKLAAREKMLGAKSPVAKDVSVFHIDTPNTVCSFGCIKDAANALAINYSTLRSSYRLKKSTPNRQGWCIKWD